MATNNIVSFSNIHQLSTSDKRTKSSPQVSPDSTNNNNINNNNNNMTSNNITPATYSSTTSTAPRGRGRKSATTYVQVIPGQPVSVARRNARERNRVKQVNNGFSNLRQHIPYSARNKKMSKVETLRCAVEYIRNLQRILSENGGYDGDMDLSHHVSSSSPVSTLDDADSAEEHSLMSMSTSDVMYETPTENTNILVDTEYTTAAATDYHPRLTSSRIVYSSDVVFDDSPLPAHPNTLIRHGSSLSPGYSDRSSVNNSPATAATATEVTTTGFMGVFAAAAGLDKSMMDLSRNSGGLMFKKERHEELDGQGLLELEGATNSAELMDAALSWWEVEQARRLQQQSS